MNSKDKTVSDKKLAAKKLCVLVAVAEKDVKEGRVKNARTFLKELKKSAKISS